MIYHILSDLNQEHINHYYKKHMNDHDVADVKLNDLLLFKHIF